MKIGVLRSQKKSEARVSLVPLIAKKVISEYNYSVIIEEKSGYMSGFVDQDYKDVGAKVTTREKILQESDILILLEFIPEEICSSNAKEGVFIVTASISEHTPALLSWLQKNKATVFSLDRMPRISRAQSMDVLSSQSNLAGYMSVIEASYHFHRIMPLMMTSAGTIIPAKVLILGVGVAGLQAIATAKRLGAVVSAYDIRIETKEQVESLAANFIGHDTDHSSTTGYAKEASDTLKIQQEKLLLEHIPDMDIVICTALIPGKKAPVLVTEKMVAKMNRGSVIIDLASKNGGNCELTNGDNIIEYNGVKIVGKNNIVNQVPYDSCSLFSKNIYNFLLHMWKQGYKGGVPEEEILNSTLLYLQGKKHQIKKEVA